MYGCLSTRFLLCIFNLFSTIGSVFSVSIFFFLIIFHHRTDEIRRQLQAVDVKAVITVVEIARIVLEATRDTSASGAPFVVIDDGSGPIPEGTVPFKVRTETDQSVSSSQTN